MTPRTRSFQYDDNKFIVDNHEGVIKIHILHEVTSPGHWLAEFALTPERASMLASQLLRFAAEQEELDNG